MESCFRLHQAGNLTLLQRKRCFVERLQHLALRKHVAVRVAGQAGILADLIHDILEVLPCVQPVKHLLCFRLCLILGTGLARRRVSQRDQDMLCRKRIRIGFLKLLDQFLVRRQVDTVFAIIVFIQRTVARTAVRHVGISIRRKAHVRQQLRIHLHAADRLDRVRKLLLKRLLLRIAQRHAEIVKVLQHYMCRYDLVIGIRLHSLQHGRAEFLVVPDIGQSEAGIHLLIIQHVVIQHARIFVRVHFVTVDGHDHRRIALDVFIVDGRTADAPHSSAHGDRHHHDQRSNAL